MRTGLPFSGITVIELGTVVSGPFAGSLLADLGAEVIKVEALGKGDVQRFLGHKKNGVSLWWGTASRNKHCIALDLKHPEGRALLEGLVRKGDVLLENYRPGAMQKLGFGWNMLHAMNPRLVMLSLSGFGQTGPMAGRPGFGKTAEGLSGLVTLTGKPDERPLMIGFSLADTCAGMFGAFGIALALYHRDARGASGSFIDLALYEPLFRMLECQIALAERSGDKPPNRRGTNDAYGWGVATKHRPQFQCVQAADGEWFFVGVPAPEALHGVAGTRADTDSLSAWAARQQPEALRKALQQAGAEIAPVLDGMSASKNAYLRARGDVLEASDPDAGNFCVPGSICPEFASANDYVPFSNTGLGEHTDEVLSRHLGLGPAELERLRSLGAIGPAAKRQGRTPALHETSASHGRWTTDRDSGEGLRGAVVLEVSGSPGASFTASLLGDFHAEVIVCETLPSGSAMRAREPAEWWQVLGRNKRSAAIDTRASGAPHAIRALVESAEVIVTDIAPAGLDADPWLREIAGVSKKPLLVHVVPTGADRPELWPWSISSDLAAATTGMMALTGWRGQSPIQPEFPLAEYLAATMAALRCVAELRRAVVAGGVRRDVLVPLHMAVQRMIEWQIPVATATGKPELRDGNTFPMNSAISNVHKTRDGGYIALSAGTDSTAANLLEMIGGPALRNDPRFASAAARLSNVDEIYRLLDEWMLQRTAAEVVEAAQRQGATLGRVCNAAEIAVDPHVNARGNIARAPAAEGGPVPLPCVVPRIAGWSAAVKSAGPALGSHTMEVFAKVGITEDAIRQLQADSI